MLGGGLVPGGVILLGGDPGIGKSTLLLQAMAAIGASRKALYVTGEESVEQVALRAQRLALINAPVSLLAEVQLETILATIGTEAPEVVVIDSIQTAYTEALTSAPGSVAQVRECAAQLTRLAKQRDIVVILVGHVTKDGSIAGPRVLEHIVDTVLYFEGDTHSSFRLVRAIKNRFGAANELGVFAMTERGLERASPIRRRSFFRSTPNRFPGRPSSPRSKAPARCWSRSRRWWTRCRGRAPGGYRWGSIRSGSHCCSLCCIATAAWKAPGTMCSSMPSAACASPSLPRTSRFCSPSIRRCEAGHCRPRRWYSARSASRARSGRFSAGRSGSRKPPSSDSASF